ncbi:MAG TPA: hypothetical protein VLK03_14530 [Nocardioides sp.]|nr:hypothetical protein [Nocardioides sp.]
MNTHDDLELMLTRDLHHQVDGMTDVPLGLGDVQGRARRIRRNRRIVAGVGVAAALALVVPTTIAGSGMLDGTSEIQPAPSPDPSPDTTPDAPVEVVRTTLTVDGLERGDDPAIEYFTPDGVVLPGEGTRALPENYQALVPGTGGGWIALAPAGDEVVYLSEDLEPAGGTPSGTTIVTTPQRDRVAWTVPVSAGQTIFLRSTTQPEDTTTWELPARPVVDVVGILGADSVVYETRTPQGEVTVGLAGPDGTTTELPYLGAMDADPVHQVFSVQTESRLSGGCFAVVEAATRLPAWETCDYALGSFSPDGAYVMAGSAEGDGAGPSSLYVLDARTGELVADFSSRGRDLVSLIRPAWESADTIVATAMGGPTTTMVRMGVDGTLEEVADPVDSADYGDVYYWIGQDRGGL